MAAQTDVRGRGTDIRSALADDELARIMSRTVPLDSLTTSSVMADREDLPFEICIEVVAVAAAVKLAAVWFA